MMLTLKNPETQSPNGCNDFLNALPGNIRALLSDCIILYLDDSVEIYVPTKIIEKRLCHQAISIYSQARQNLGVSEMTIVSDNGRFTVDQATADFFQTSTTNQKTMNYSTAIKNTANRFQPYSELQKKYGEGLGRLNGLSVIQAITVLGFSITQSLSVATLLDCGDYYSELKRFPVLVKVLSNQNLSEWAKTNLISLLAQTL